MPLLALGLTVGAALLIQAQTTGPCGYPILDTNPSGRWPRGAVVEYQLSDNVTEPARSQILRAIDQWNYENKFNGSEVQFTPGSENATYGLRIQFGVTSTGAAAEFDPPRTDANGYLAGGAITLNPNHFFNEVSPRALTFDPNQPGYDTIISNLPFFTTNRNLRSDSGTRTVSKRSPSSSSFSPKPSPPNSNSVGI